jgi:CheY-like chemotaxis protein
MRPLKIFIVDDDPDFAEGIAITLEFAGHQVAFARSGEEAVRKFREVDFDITFMDVRMPGINGVESFFEFRKIRPEAKVVLMTAHSVEDMLRRAIDAGALGVMHKPFGSDELLRVLNDVKPAGVILVADDDPDFVEGVERVLSGAGYTVIAARTGQEAVDKALGDGFDVLILDLRLPILSGLEVYLKLKEHDRTLPTIIATGYDVEESESIDALLQMSVMGCLVKPIASADLLGAIEQSMAKSTQEST